jgi:hypothetical protein
MDDNPFPFHVCLPVDHEHQFIVQIQIPKVYVGPAYDGIRPDIGGLWTAADF